MINFNFNNLRWTYLGLDVVADGVPLLLTDLNFNFKWAHLGLDVLVADGPQRLDVVADGVAGVDGPRVHGHEDALVTQRLPLTGLDADLRGEEEGRGG